MITDIQQTFQEQFQSALSNLCLSIIQYCVCWLHFMISALFELVYNCCTKLSQTQFEISEFDSSAVS